MVQGGTRFVLFIFDFEIRIYFKIQEKQAQHVCIRLLLMHLQTTTYKNESLLPGTPFLELDCILKSLTVFLCKQSTYKKKCQLATTYVGKSSHALLIIIRFLHIYV